jgi:SAM-dependent methyltransferase
VPLKPHHQETLGLFFHSISSQAPKERAAKLGQILAYIDIIDAQIRQYGPKRPLVFIDCGAGNAYLSFLVYYFYTVMQQRPLTVHCLDTNRTLIAKARQRALDLHFDGMSFHAGDIADFTLEGRVDLVYALHACDAATDKTLYLGLRQRASCILSVACCQHGLVRQLHGGPLMALTRHRLFKERMAYMAGDTLRALLLETRGYKTDILEFAPSRFTDKNTMVRARKEIAKYHSTLQEDYEHLQQTFELTPALESYLRP